MPIAIRDKLIANGQPFLEPGEQIQYAFVGQTMSGYWGLLTWLVLFKMRYRAVAVTERRIIVFDTARLSTGTIRSVLRSLPRQTRIGPVQGMWAKTETLGERLYVHKRFHKDIAAADGAAGFAS